MNVITSKISMDLMIAPKELPVIHTVQGERSTRAVELSLFCAGSPWQIPDGIHLAVRYGRIGQGGYYDTLPDGGCAYSYEENRVTIILAPQMMAVSGPVTAQVELIHGDQMLATFSFKVMVAVNPAVGIVEPEDYVNWQKWLEQELDKYVEKVSQGGQLLGGTMAGPINMNSHVLNGLNLPVSNDQAANMEFVNRQIEKNVLRKNQLDNWYFGNPVNQRGVASGAGWNQGYGLDRWRALYNNAVNWNSDGYLEMPQGFDNCIIEQYFEKGFGNEPVTVSILCKDGKLYTQTVNWSEDREVFLFNGTVFDGSRVGLVGGKPTFRLWRQKDYEADVKIVAIKLELGSVQTLARQVNDAWVLNEIPDYSAEFAECSRYYNHIGNATLVGHFVNGVGFIIPVSVPSKMRGDLNVSAVTTDAVQVFNEGGVWTNVSIQGVTHVGGGVYHLKFDAPDDTVRGNTYLVIGIIALSADL